MTLIPILALALTTRTPDPFAARDAELKARWSRTEFERTFAHRTAQVGEVRLHYVIGGKGDPVVLLHGFPATWYDYRLVMPELARTHTVIAVDLRGLGDSSRPLSGYDARTVAADVAGLVRLLGYTRIDLVGHDIGAPVAYAYAKANPAGVRRLVEMEFVLASAGLEELEAKQSPNLWFFQFQAVRDLPETLVAGRERTYLSAFFNGFTASGSAIGPEAMDEYVRAYSQPGAFRAGFEYYREVPTVARQTQEDKKLKLPMPVLALAGDHSMGAPGLGDPAKASIAQLAADFRYEVVPDSGHWIAEERPAWLAARLERFLGEGR